MGGGGRTSGESMVEVDSDWRDGDLMDVYDSDW